MSGKYLSPDAIHGFIVASFSRSLISAILFFVSSFTVASVVIDDNDRMPRQAMFTIDLSDLRETHREAVRALDQTLPVMRGAVALNLAIEKGGHPYQNRTTNLERSTIWYDAADPKMDPFSVYAEMGMFYASFVNERGYSLIDSVMKNAAEEIETRLNQLGDGID